MSADNAEKFVAGFTVPLKSPRHGHCHMHQLRVDAVTLQFWSDFDEAKSNNGSPIFAQFYSKLAPS